MCFLSLQTDMTVQSTNLQLHSEGTFQSITTVNNTSAVKEKRKTLLEGKTTASKIGKSKDTLDIPSETTNIPLKSCILIPKGDDPDEKIIVKKSKSVHFADSLGKPLKLVKTLYDNNDDYLDLSFLSLKSTTRRTFPVDIFKKNYNNRSFGNVVERKSKLVNFKQPVTLKDFQSIIESKNVCLENIVFREYGVFGTVAVKNMSFEKEISIRYTFNKWEDFDLVNASFVPGSSTGLTDTFSFEIFPPMSKVDSTEIQFAICYATNTSSYWDSNFGNNYIVLFIPNSGKEQLNDMDDCGGFILPRQNFIGWST